MATQVMTTVDARYGANLFADQLAAKIADPKRAAASNASVFAFFSEVPAAVQKQFQKGMGVDEAQVSRVAGHFATLSGYTRHAAA